MERERQQNDSLANRAGRRGLRHGGLQVLWVVERFRIAAAAKSGGRRLGARPDARGLLF